MEKKYDKEIKDGLFNKPKLPKFTNIKSVEDMAKFQQEFNHYLALLAQDPKEEFIKFISDNNEQSFTSDSSNPNLSSRATHHNNPNCSIDLLKEFWTTETLAKVTLNLNEFGIEEFTYIIQITYKDASYRIQKKKCETIQFYDKMVDSFKTFNLRKPFDTDELVMDKKTLKNVEYFHMQVLNNADLFCNYVWDYFGDKTTETPHHIYNILQSQQSALKDFKVISNVTKVEFQLDDRRNVQIVSA